MGFAIGTLSSIAANLIFWVLLGVAFWSIGLISARRFAYFFGLRNSTGIAVYLSNLYTSGISLIGRPDGRTISIHELRGAQSVDRVLGSAPLRLPELVRGLVDSIWLRGKIESDIIVSPLDPAGIDFSRNMIVIGSAVRNSVRGYYLGRRLPVAAFSGEYKGLLDFESTIVAAFDDGKTPIGESGKNVGILEKCRDREHGIVVFFCLGKRADSSWGAAEYLVRHWNKLAREFGDSDFLVYLEWPQMDSYLESYMEPARVEFKDESER